MKRFFSTLLIVSFIFGAMLLVSCTNTPDVEHTHNFTSVVVAPTCSRGGYTEHKCDCGYIKRDTFTNPSNSNHDFEKQGAFVEPTCTTEGYQLYVCSICGEEQIKDKKPASHTWGEWIITKEPNCDDMGMQRRECDFCDVYEEETMPSDHIYGEPVVTPADCDTPEILTYTCTYGECGFQKVETGKPALGHKFGDWYVYNDSTCDEVGEMRRDCLRCDGNVNNCEIEDCDHSDCGDVRCDVPGCDHSTCGTDICDHYESKEIPRHHFTVEIKVEPGCSTHGYEGHKCENCDKEEIDRFIDPLGHNYGEWHAVEGNPNLEQRECETCGDVESRSKQ